MCVHNGLLTRIWLATAPPSYPVRRTAPSMDVLGIIYNRVHTKRIAPTIGIFYNRGLQCCSCFNNSRWKFIHKNFITPLNSINKIATPLSTQSIHNFHFDIMSPISHDERHPSKPRSFFFNFIIALKARFPSSPLLARSLSVREV